MTDGSHATPERRIGIGRTMNEESEFWADYRRRQHQRRDKREEEFEASLSHFEEELQGLGLTFTRPMEYHFQIRKNGNVVADYWPRPHHKFRIGNKYKNASSANHFIAILKDKIGRGKRGSGLGDWRLSP